MKHISQFLFALILSTPAANAATNIHCFAKGDKAGGNDAGPLMVDVSLHLSLAYDCTAKGHVISGGGEMKIASPFEELKSPEELNEDNAYIGIFNLVNTPENTNYRPRRYKGFMQFPYFDAVETKGRESGMWGALLLQRIYKTAPRFQAKYIFRAGDHMGGTLHLTCTRE